MPKILQESKLYNKKKAYADFSISSDVLYKCVSNNVVYMEAQRTLYLDSSDRNVAFSCADRKTYLRF